VVKHSVKGKVVTITVSVPSAGKLTASGKGLSKASKSSKAATTLTVKLTLSKVEQAFLKKHHAKRLKATKSNAGSETFHFSAGDTGRENEQVLVPASLGPPDIAKPKNVLAPSLMW